MPTQQQRARNPIKLEMNYEFMPPKKAQVSDISTAEIYYPLLYKKLIPQLLNNSNLRTPTPFF